MTELIEVPKAGLMREITIEALHQVRAKALQSVLPDVIDLIKAAASDGRSCCRFESAENKNRPIISETLVNYLNSQGYAAKADNRLNRIGSDYVVTVTISWSNAK